MNPAFSKITIGIGVLSLVFLSGCYTQIAITEENNDAVYLRSEPSVVFIDIHLPPVFIDLPDYPEDGGTKLRDQESPVRIRQEKNSNLRNSYGRNNNVKKSRHSDRENRNNRR